MSEITGLFSFIWLNNIPVCVLCCAKSLQSCLTLCDPMDYACQAPHPRNSPGKNTGVGCPALLQGIFPTQYGTCRSYVSCKYTHFSLPTFLVAQMIKNPPARWETWVQSLGWEDPLKEGMSTHSSILAWRIPMDGGAWRTTVHGVEKSWTQLRN